MEELKLEHLAPYLPYGLKIYIWCGGYEKPLEYPKIIGLYGDSVIQSSYQFKSSYCGDDIFTRPKISVGISIIKPILRPLIDLTKDIEHNGELFVPMEKFYNERECDYEYDFLEAIENDWASSGDKIIFSPYSIIKKLLKYHFDVFGLIEKGLAIDINKL